MCGRRIRRPRGKLQSNGINVVGQYGQNAGGDPVDPPNGN